MENQGNLKFILKFFDRLSQDLYYQMFTLDYISL
jgi:hypothetical protein